MPAGRKPKELDPEEFEKLCHIHATRSEIESWFGVANNTLDAWVERHYGSKFSEVYKRYSEGGKASLRRHLFKLAQNGNVAAAIFLSKNLLGMRDRFDIDASVAHTHTHKISEESKAELIHEVREVLATIDECKNTSSPPPLRLSLPSLQ